MNKPIYIVDLFRDIVLDTQNAIVGKNDQGEDISLLSQLASYDPKITGVHYLHGHPLEIIETLAQYGQSMNRKFDRFPLVALLQDFPETIGVPGFYGETTLHFLIARGTEATYKADQRYEKNFKPVLYPIYFNFLEQVRLSKKFEIVNGGSTFPHTKIDRLYYGREGLYGGEANKLNDRIDCIEIKELKLRIKTQNC